VKLKGIKEVSSWQVVCMKILRSGDHSRIWWSYVIAANNDKIVGIDPVLIEISDNTTPYLLQQIIDINL
jgi:hypothetical protein